MSGLAAVLKQIAATAWLAGYLAGAASGGDSQPETKAAAGKDKFAGKALLVNVKGPPEWFCLIDDVQTRTLGDRTFIVGTLADEGSGRNPWVGLTVWIPPDQAYRIIEFKDLDEAKKAYRSQVTPHVTAARPDANVLETDEPSFALPIQIDAARKSSVKRVLLYTSTDEGKTWNRVADAGPEETQFHFDAPREGLYWFAVQVIKKDGTKDPPEDAKFTPAMKIRIKGNASHARFSAPVPPGKETSEEKP